MKKVVRVVNGHQRSSRGEVAPRSSFLHAGGNGSSSTARTLPAPPAEDDIDIVEIHTSDRNVFRRCRRKWEWQSELRHHLGAKNDPEAAPLWYGTGWHFVMEDFHGYNLFGHPLDAFREYYRVYKTYMPEKMPDEADELMDLAEAMLDYYLEHWLPRRDDTKTLWIDNVPQVEVRFQVPIPGFEQPIKYQGRWILLVYGGTFDRVVRDSYGRYWVVDYKSVKRFDTTKLENDPQIGAYTWASSLIYGYDFEGVIYQQFLKKVPKKPNLLKNGSFSQNKSQDTTYALYHSALKEAFGGTPKKYRPFLNFLLSGESEDGDAFIRRDFCYRNEYSRNMESMKIAMEARDMISPELAIYPNPTRDCIWDCNFRSACLAFDDGSDWEFILDDEFEYREEMHPWRKYLEYPAPQTVAPGATLQLTRS